MNETVNKFFLEREKFIPEIHLKQPGFTYSACGLFTKNKERIQKNFQTGNTGYIYKNNLDKACSQYDMAYGKYKDLTKRTESHKVLREIWWVWKRVSFNDLQVFDKNSKFQISNQQLADELHKSIIRKFKKQSVYSSFKNNICGADLADMQLISKYNKGIQFYVWSILLVNMLELYL